MLKDVINFGTAPRALSLGRKDLAGKTGTTNENVDAWFCGFNASIVGVSWIGFDQPRTLGTNETGGVAALPIWISFMQKALKGVPEKPLTTPDGVITVKVNPDTGLRDDAGGVAEYFFAEYPPAGRGEGLAPQVPGRSPQDVRDQLF
jgi:penicillin-binding protein 1A